MNEDHAIRTVPQAEDIETEAAEWLMVISREEQTDEDVEAFYRWYDANERHRAAFNRVRGVWAAFGKLGALDAIAGETPPPERSAIVSRRTGLALAASLAAVAIGGGVIVTLNPFGASHYETALGESREIDLPDGSTVQLNTASGIEVAFSRRARTVRLLAGEAHFIVAKDASRPFTVEAAGGEVIAVGTAFTVRLHAGDAMEVTVEEGRVALAPAAETEKGSAAAPEITPLSAGERAEIRGKVEAVEKVSVLEIERRLAWRDGLLIYDGQSLADVVSDVVRYTDIKIEIADVDIGAQSVSGRFRVGQWNDLFRALELNLNVKVERLGAKHVRLASADAI